MKKHTVITFTKEDAEAINRVINIFDEIASCHYAQTEGNYPDITRSDLRLLLNKASNSTLLADIDCNFLYRLSDWKDLTLESEAE